MIELDLRGVAELAQKNTRFLRDAGKALKNSLTRTTRRGATAVKRDVRASGIGRRIWGKDPSGLTKQKLVAAISPRVRGDAIEAGLRFKGIPKLIEEGGRIKQHKIIGKTKRGLLVFEGHRGTVFARGVRHPGGPVRQHGFGAAWLRQNESMISEDVNQSIRKVVEETYGG